MAVDTMPTAYITSNETASNETAQVVFVVISTLSSSNTISNLDAWNREIDDVFVVPRFDGRLRSRCVRRPARELFTAPVMADRIAPRPRCIGRSREARTPSYRASRRS
jgi:hypothetical protein